MMKSSYDLTASSEQYTRKIIEDKLKNLAYEVDETSSSCNVYRERAKYHYQQVALHGRKPDFLIYETNTDRILAVIEAKRPGFSSDKAIDQVINFYAKPLNIPIIFLFNASSFYACSIEKKPIKIDDIEINDFVNEQTLIDLINHNFSIESFKCRSITKIELLTKFKTVNNLLRKDGLREGYERFSAFADLLFLKLKSNLKDFSEISNNPSQIDKIDYWKKLQEKIEKLNLNTENSEIKSFYEDTIKKQLKNVYGDIFETTATIKNESTLIEVIKEIDSIDFRDLDTDVKGDAFEFFLRSVTNGNKDLGEYYTPRHIVKMIVKLLNPAYGEKIYDPCCGTGGFLLECFKHLKNNTNTDITEKDSEEAKNEKRKKMWFIRHESIYGKELTSTARIAKMNMILFGDGHTNIEQRDCLSKPENGKFDIAVSNIPYSQKVEWGQFYDFPTDNGDSLFVQHIWRSLGGGGRMAVIVPETFLSSQEKCIRYIRKRILDESSKCIVISLPRGVFQPYTPTKTSVLVAFKKKNESEQLKEVSAYVIRNDGFELGARRRPLSGQSDCTKFLMDYNDDKNLRNFTIPNACDIPFSDIVSNDYDLFPFRYMEHLPTRKNDHKLDKIGEYITERNEKFDLEKFQNPDEDCVILSITQNGIYVGEYLSASDLADLNQTYKRVEVGDIVYSPPRINVGSIGIVPNLAKNMYISNLYVAFYINDTKKLPPYYLLKLLKSKEYRTIINDYCLGGARANLKIEQLKKIKVYLPTPDESKNIVEQSEKIENAYQTFLTLYNGLMK